MTSGTPENEDPDVVRHAAERGRGIAGQPRVPVLLDGLDDGGAVGDAVAPPRLPHAMRGATRSTIRGLVIGSSMRPIQLMRNSLVIDVRTRRPDRFSRATRCEPRLSGRVIATIDGRRSVSRPRAQELFRDLGGRPLPQYCV